MFLRGFFKCDSMAVKSRKKRTRAVVDGFCTKAIYKTPEEADRAAHVLQLLNGAKQRKYLCKKCDFYHLTTVV